MSVEGFVLLNLVSDAALLGAVSRALGLFSLKRVAAASALCAAYGALAAARPAIWASPPAQLILLAAVATLITFGASVRLTVTAALSLAAAALLAGGTAWLLPVRGAAAAIPCAAAGGLLATALFSVRPPGVRDYTARVRLVMDGRTARFDALIDTGNRLREPLSGLPVLVAEAALVRRILPRRGYRTVRFGAIGAEGSMVCFKPTSVWIERGHRARRVPDLWVAVSESPLPGLYRALAPRQLIDTI